MRNRPLSATSSQAKVRWYWGGSRPYQAGREVKTESIWGRGAREGEREGERERERGRAHGGGGEKIWAQSGVYPAFSLCKIIINKITLRLTCTSLAMQRATKWGKGGGMHWNEHESEYEWQEERLFEIMFSVWGLLYESEYEWQVANLKRFFFLCLKEMF